jgi:tRNA (mo5U34)-methyltransferase
MDASTELAEKIGRYDWFHTIDFGNGVVSRGHCTAEVLRAKADCYFSVSPKGKTVLDIGCWDGYFSLEALRRGAARVLATDHYVWHSHWNRGSFNLVHERLAPELEVRDIDVFDISPSTVGRFDFVLFTGVLYHTRHPLLALENAASVCTDVLVVETVLDAIKVPQPAMVFYPGSELKQDPSNWWGPNQLCVEAMLRDVGFANIAFIPTPIPRKWTVFDRIKQNPAITPRGVFHARRGS